MDADDPVIGWGDSAEGQAALDEVAAHFGRPHGWRDVPEVSGDPNGPRCLSDRRLGWDTGASHE
jgi:hypothetical protein